MPERDADAHSVDNGDSAYAGDRYAHATHHNREGVERQLAHYAFMREEHEREVRLHFRDVPAGDIARALRLNGASLISISGERASLGQSPNKPASVPASTGHEGDPEQEHRAHKRRGEASTILPEGELTLRYFYVVGELVYTINIVSASGIVQSIASVFPVAALSERELRDRLGIVFTGTEAC